MESNEKTIWDLLKKPSDLRNNEVDPYEFDRRKEDSKNIKERNIQRYLSNIGIILQNLFHSKLAVRKFLYLFFRCFDSCGTCTLYFNCSHG